MNFKWIISRFFNKIPKTINKHFNADKTLPNNDLYLFSFLVSPQLLLTSRFLLLSLIALLGNYGLNWAELWNRTVCWGETPIPSQKIIWGLRATKSKKSLSFPALDLHRIQSWGCLCSSKGIKFFWPPLLNCTPCSFHSQRGQSSSCYLEPRNHHPTNLEKKKKSKNTLFPSTFFQM